MLCRMFAIYFYKPEFGALKKQKGKGKANVFLITAALKSKVFIILTPEPIKSALEVIPVLFVAAVISYCRF